MSTDNASNRKTVVKNTLFLYVRMFFTMLVGLYTSRVVLNTLGVSDYGVYNVVGGVITMMSFLNAAMMGATQRFMAFELGRNNLERLGRVFSNSISVYLIICLIAIVFSETIGLWFVNAKLNIPDGRMVAANWVYQASILVFLINMLTVPFNAAIIAHERMSIYAYVSILDAFLKLVIVYLLVIIPADKLKTYSVLMVCISLVPLIIYSIFSLRKFEECKLRVLFDKVLLKEMFAYAGWSLLGNFAFSWKNQGSNIIINIFHGTAVNAARSVGITVSTMVNSFASNFMMALSPQITKQYSSGNLEESRKLVYAGSKFSYFLLMLITIPLAINIDYVLKLWLINVPEYTKQFALLSLVASLLYSMSGCVTIAIQATGKVKWFQIGVCIIILSELPVAWFLLKQGYPPYSAMWPTVGTYSIALIYRFWLLRSYVEGYSLREYLLQVVSRCLLVTVLGYLICWALFHNVEESIWFVLYTSVISMVICSMLVFFVGLQKWERNYVLSHLTTYISNRFSKNKRSI